jgi:hypothetical protein
MIGDKLDQLISKSPNVKGLLDSGIANATMRDIVSSINRNEISAVMFIEVSPESVGLLPIDLKDVATLSITSRASSDSSMTNITLASTPWSEKEGHFTGISGAILPVHVGMVPIGEERSIRWIFDHYLNF